VTHAVHEVDTCLTDVLHTQLTLFTVSVFQLLQLTSHCPYPDQLVLFC